MLATLAAFLLLRLAARRGRAHPSPFHPMLRTTPAALELLPETQTEADLASSNKETH